MKVLKKLLKWIPANLASVLGITQAVLKLLKEILTAIVNFLFPIIPSTHFQSVVLKVREVVNVVDGFVERVKRFFLGKVHSH